MNYLLAISIGPVQEFIAAGRRTNDLYAGSELISEVSREASKAVQDAGGELIFPAKGIVPDLNRSIPNKILAKVTDPRAVAAMADAAARAYLRRRWGTAPTKPGDNFTSGLDAIQSKYPLADDEAESARQQIDAFIELYTAWWPWDGENGQSYQQARQEVERLLSGRKALRDFKQPQKRPGVSKSILDPARDSVIKDPKTCATWPLRLKNNEYLDAVSVLKRVRGTRREDADGKKIDPVPSTSDIAARTLEVELASGFETERQQLQLLHDAGKAGFVGHLVFESQRKEILENESDSDEAKEVKAAEDAFKLAELRIPEAKPYYAILLADGDRMGERISKMTSPAEHESFSEKQAKYAAEAADTVRAHQGHCVYSGGDDVLALLPVHTALTCAAKLAEDFASEIENTLSVGIAVVHYRDPLQVGIRKARAAEKKAKNKEAGKPDDRGNRLAFVFHTRSGQERTAVWTWREGYDFASWRRWWQLFTSDRSGGRMHGLPYELEMLAREAYGAGIPEETLNLEACRIFCRKEGAPCRKADDHDGRKQPEHWAAEDLTKATTSPEALADFARLLIILRELGQYPIQWPELKP